MRPIAHSGRLYRLIAGASLWLAALACCHRAPEPTIPFHEGEARISRAGPPAFPQSPVRSFVADAVLASPDGPGDGFGRSVAVGGGVVVVGAPEAANGGAVWVFDASDPRRAPTRLTVPAARGLQGVGASVAVSARGLYVAAGAPTTSLDGMLQCGAVVLWRRDAKQWTLVDVLREEPPVEHALLGSTVGVSESVLVASAPRADIGNRIDAGLVLVWKRELTGPWRFAQNLLPVSGNSGAVFGESLALCDDPGPPLVREALVGARHARSASGTGSGNASLFREVMGRWRVAPNALLVGSKCEALDRFGDAVATARGLALVGAPGANLPQGVDAGRAYVFRCEDGRNWFEEAVLESPTPAARANFGSNLAVCANRAVVTEPGATVGASRGRVFAFQREKTGNGNQMAWKPLFELVSARPQPGSLFGAGVAASGDMVVVTELAAEGTSASVHLFRRTDSALGVEATPITPEPAVAPTSATADPSNGNPESVENRAQPPASQGSV